MQGKWRIVKLCGDSRSSELERRVVIRFAEPAGISARALKTKELNVGGSAFGSRNSVKVLRCFGVKRHSPKTQN